MPVNNHITLDLNAPKRKISPLIYGSFIEHIGECIHNGLWVYDKVNVPLVEDVPLFKNGVRKDVLQAIKDLKPTLLRAFGGCYADVYHWEDAIGPKSSRKKVKNLHWGIGNFGTIEGLGPDIDNQFGTDEFLTLCEMIGARAYLNINYGSGTPEEAANWVEYCNCTKDTKFGELRVKYGRREPYNVKLWGIANEIFASWEKGYEEFPENYAEKYLKFAEKMKEKDPKIKLVAVGYDNSEWNQTVLNKIGEEWIDYLSIHRYLPKTSGASAGKKRRLNEKIYHAIMASILLIEEYIDDTWRDITKILGENTHVRISFDEWGLWYLMTDAIKTNYNILDGIWTALTLMVFQSKSKICPIANWAQLVNCMGIIRTDSKGIILTPIYFVFKLFIDHTHNNLVEDLKINSENFSNKRYASIPAMEGIPYIECNATTNDEGDKLSIMIINKHFDNNLKVGLEIKGFEPKKIGSKVELTSESPFDFNTIEDRTKIGPIESEFNNISKQMELEVKPHSIAILKLSRNE